MADELGSKEVIEQVVGAVGEVSKFIDGPRPGGLVSGAYHDHARWVCDSYAAVPPWVTAAATVAGAPNVALGMGEICGEYLDDKLPVGVPPFTGGQCPVFYSVVARYSDEAKNGLGVWEQRVFESTRVVIGPIQGLDGHPDDPPLARELCIVHGSPTQYTRTGLATRPYPCSSNPDFYRDCQDSIVSVVRVDGLPDTCGNPNPELSPSPTAGPDPGPDPAGGFPPIWVPGVGPVFLPGPIDTPVGPVDFPPVAPLDPTSDPTPPVPPPPPGDRGEPDSPVDVGPGADHDDEKSDKVLVGVRVTLTTISPKGRVSFLGGKAFYSYAYSVLMGGDGGVERDGDSAFAQADTFYHAPENSNRYSVAFRAGYGGTVVPYWKDPD